MNEPYGGRLVDLLAKSDRVKRLKEEVMELQAINLSVEEELDLDKLAIGAYSPLEGFMTSEELESTISRCELPGGLPWTMPIILDVSEDEVGFSEGDMVRLEGRTLGALGVMRVKEIYRFDPKELAERVYGTLNERHPNVRKLLSKGENMAVGGKVELIKRPVIDQKLARYDLTPLEVRSMIREKGWRSIVGFQCRNPPHIGHEYIQRLMMELYDGLLIHPVTGLLKEDDYPPEAIIESYEALLSNYYPRGKVLLASLGIEMRYAGPKAAVFLAIIRRNYGCTHFVVGRDMAGVGNFYDPYEAQHTLLSLKDDLGIEPVCIKEVHYCKRCGWGATESTCAHAGEAENVLRISQTSIRSAMKSGQSVPVEVVRREVLEVLKRYYP
ncbi:MAG: sulfate adenylyltransferase [Nitrososphaerota archaeon]